MDYAGDILKQRMRFDAVLSGLPKNTILYANIYSVRNLYIAQQEITVKKTSLRELLVIVYNAGRTALSMFVNTPVLKGSSNAVLLEINKDKEQELVEKLNITLASVLYVRSFSVRSLMRVRFITEWLIATVYLLTRRELNKIFICKCLQEMLLGIFVYRLSNLAGIKVLVTQRDRYPVELAILRRAKERGIKTIRIEDFPSMGRVNRDTILCDYYFCPNAINKEIFRSFKQNDSVIFVDGGFPFWDAFSRHQYKPSQHPRIISYWTQYGTEIGIFGRKGPAFYIEEILSVLPDDYVLYIKVHPLDDPNAYAKYVSDKVTIVPHGAVPNATLMTISTYVFSINSFSSFEAKHMNPNAYFINYYPEEVMDFSYDFVTDYIDLIKSRSELKEVLTGTRRPKDQRLFIDFFNPGYPHTTNKLSAFIRDVAKS